ILLQHHIACYEQFLSPKHCIVTDIGETHGSCCRFSKPGPCKRQHPDSRVVAVSVRPELQTVGFAPQRRSADDCCALDGDYQILRRAEALGASRLARAGRNSLILRAFRAGCWWPRPRLSPTPTAAICAVVDRMSLAQSERTGERADPSDLASEYSPNAVA